MTTKISIVDHFTNAAKFYDDRNQKLSPIVDNLHFLLGLILKNIPSNSHVLCVGVGTGTEILSLLKSFPDWTFVGVDPSSGMLDVCREKLKEAGVLDRCKLVHGYVSDLPLEENFHAVLSLFVGHFVKREERLNFYKGMFDRLCSNGFLVNTEISYDLDSKEFPLMLKNWESIQLLMGATQESIANLSQVLREMLTILSPKEVEYFLNQSGVDLPIHFFQSFIINAWYGIKI